jgi:hypothetical protein
VSVLINTCREKGSNVDILDYIGKEKHKREIMAVVWSVVVVQEMVHMNVIWIHLRQTLD